MAYLMGYEDEPQAEWPLPDSYQTAFQQFQNGNFEAAAATLGPQALTEIGLISTGVGAALAAALAVGLALSKMIGRGRTEADIITPVQNQLVNNSGTGQLDQITQILVRNPNVGQLQALYDQVQRIGLAFLDFVSSGNFTDGRASEQAANTIMPYINGTCGYVWPPPLRPSQTGCLTWGQGTPGGAGQDGMLGAIARAILRLGGALPPPMITQGYGGALPRLGPQGEQNYPFITQSGTLPNNSPLSPIRPSSVPVVSAGFGTDLLLPLALLGGFLYLRRRG